MMTSSDGHDLLQRDIQLGWTLYDAQPANPQIAEIARRVLTADPTVTSMQILLAKHLVHCGEPDQARDLLLAVVGLRDDEYLNAARELISLEHEQHNHTQARRWAQTVLREDPGAWEGLLELGGMSALSGDVEAGARLMDDAVSLCADHAAQYLPQALAYRAMLLFQAVVPPERFLAAAEAAMAADPSTEFVTTPLIWGYLQQGRFAEAEQLARRVLRLDPLNQAAAQALEMMRTLQDDVAQLGKTLTDLHHAGLFDRIWNEMRDRLLGVGLDAALAALEEVMPAPLRNVLAPPVTWEAAEHSQMKDQIAIWHSGQAAGAGAVWGLPGEFRLMSSDQIGALQHVIETEPDSYSQWRRTELTDDYDVIMTDDEGGYLLELLTGSVVIRRAGEPDQAVAPSLADWIWSRVVAFGGEDPRAVVPT
ncbi:MAG: tetratricopeptide repeat protein [Beutenbergiaceae bacterium]